MNDKILEMLSAYLDGQLNRADTKEIEQLINSDAAVKEEYEAMKSFSRSVDASRPADVEAPEGFRDSIMAKIEVQASGHNGDGRTNGQGKTFLKSKWMTYLATGGVLAGLTGWFAYQDYQNSKKISAAEKIVEQVQDMKKSTAIEMPEYQGVSPSQDNFIQASPEDIQGSTGDREEALTDKKTLDGSVYTGGSGPGSLNTEAVTGETEQPAVPDSGISNSQTIDLESGQGWSEAGINKILARKDLTGKIAASKCRSLGIRHNLNPGLIISLIELNPSEPIEPLLIKVRDSLDQTVTLPADKRIDAIIKLLHGDSSWKKIIKKNLRP